MEPNNDQNITIQHSIWEGAVPIVFQLFKNEVTALIAPEPHYVGLFL